MGKRHKAPERVHGGQGRPPYCEDIGDSHRLLDVRANDDVYEAIRQGREDVLHGRTLPARAVFNEMRRRYGIPR